MFIMHVRIHFFPLHISRHTCPNHQSIFYTLKQTLQTVSLSVTIWITGTYSITLYISSTVFKFLFQFDGYVLFILFIYFLH